MRALIASGASAGHLYPALAFAQALRRKAPGLDMAFVSSRRAGLENRIKESGYRAFFISIEPFSFHSIKKLPRAVHRLVRAFLESFFLIKKFSPDVVVGFGSYVSFPVVLSAALFKKPTVIHEQNVCLGLANKCLSFFVDKVALSFPGTSAPGSKSLFTGNPLRRSLIREDKETARRFFGLEEKFTILTLGGSQGAHKINVEFKKAVDILEKEEDFQFIHISGENDYSDLKNSYGCIKIKHCLFDFLAQMHLAYSLADLVVCRAGAGTISELAYFKKAAVLVPYPYAAGHQLENARTLNREGAALVIEEKELNCLKLSGRILELMHSDARRNRLENNIQKFAIDNADEKLAELVLSLCKK